MSEEVKAPATAADDSFKHTGEHVLLALYDGGRLWFRPPFDDANWIGDAAEEALAAVHSLQSPQPAHAPQPSLPPSVQSVGLDRLGRYVESVQSVKSAPPTHGSRPSFAIELNGRTIHLIRCGNGPETGASPDPAATRDSAPPLEIHWEALIDALDLPARTMPGRDPEEVWLALDQVDRVEAILGAARIATNP